ncbi:sensor histidine kinase [Luteolibacter algae]|uniref:Sensor histidine kinase n=1 Tax=Luteolibacter algae TaxID=454151 RepID=A0ABW5D8W8_9BACT
MFWRIQLIGWLSFIILSFPLKLIFYDSLQFALIVTLVREPVGILITASFRKLYQRRELDLSKPFRLICLILGVSISGASIDIILERSIAAWSGRSFALDPIFGLFWFRSLLYTMWSLLYIGLKNQLAIHNQQAALSAAETAARDAEILMLRAQASPHFLFNAFNTILAELDGKNAELMPVVRGLSDYFRYSLTSRSQVFVRLKDEFEAIKAYLVVEKARFQENLMISCHMDEELGDIRVPGIFLQPLIENALKYGHRTSESPLKINIEIRALEEGYADVRVSNSGSWVEPDSGTELQKAEGNGLEILRRRLELLYPGKHHFRAPLMLAENEVTVSIIIPTQAPSS